MGMSSTCVLMYAMPSLKRCIPCIFVMSVVTSTILLSVTAVILLLCNHVATERYMLLLEMFSKDVL